MTKELNMNNIFQKGALLIFNCKMWGASAKLNDDMMPEILPKEIIRAVQDIITDTHKTKLDALKSIKRDVDCHIKSYSIPFPVRGLRFIPKEFIENVDEYIKEKTKSFYTIASEICNSIDEMESDYKDKYPDLYRPEKYPSKNQLSSKFVFDHSFKIFAVPDKELGVLTPKMYKEEVKKAKEDIQEIKNMTLSIVKNELITLIKRLKDRCDDGKPNQRTLNSINSFVTKFDSLWKDYTGSSELKTIVKDIKEYMDGVDAEMLRCDKDFRKIIGDVMQETTNEIEKIATKPRKRGLDL